MLLLPLLIAAVAPPAPAQHRPLDFGRDIIPLLTRYGCNAGGCHGKASGQGGFKMSLLGFEPDLDFTSLVKEARGRRLFPASPEASLLLLQPLAHDAGGNVFHSGGRQFRSKNDAGWKTLAEWVRQAKPAR